MGDRRDIVKGRHQKTFTRSVLAIAVNERHSPAIHEGAVSPEQQNNAREPDGHEAATSASPNVGPNES